MRIDTHTDRTLAKVSDPTRGIADLPISNYGDTLALLLPSRK